MPSLKILSGGAAQGLIERFAPAFKVRTSYDIDGEFSAVGAMAAKLRAGTFADLVLLTDAVVDDLCSAGLLVASSRADIGRVETAVAVRSGDPAVSIGEEESLRAAFLASDAIFVPDMKISTAGVHVARVLQQLGIAGDVAARLQIFPNGVTAMIELAKSDFKQPLGCTQVTEIIRTTGLQLVGPLPGSCALATIYSAALTVGAARPSVGQALIDFLAAPEQLAIREQTGFLPTGTRSVLHSPLTEK